MQTFACPSIVVDPVVAGKSVKDSQKLSELNVDKTGKIYFKDLGPQIGWSTVRIALHRFSSPAPLA